MESLEFGGKFLGTKHSPSRGVAICFSQVISRVSVSSLHNKRSILLLARNLVNTPNTLEHVDCKKDRIDVILR